MTNNKKLIASLTFSGFLIAMSIILQRFFVIPFGMPSLYRISLGSLPIIMASLFLGPIYGGIVGAASDLIGASLFPVAVLLPWPVISATLYGILPWLFLRLIKHLNRRIKVPLLYPFLGVVFITLVTYVLIKDDIRHPFDKTQPPIMFTPLFRVIFTAVLVVLFAFIIVVTIYLEKRYKDKHAVEYVGTPTSLAFAILLTAFIVDVLYTSFWKMYAYGPDFFVSVFFHTAIMFILFPIQTSIISLLGNVYQKSSIARLLGKTPVVPEEHDEITEKDE